MKRLSVRHAHGEYEVAIGEGVLAGDGLFALVRARPVVIVTDDNVAPHWLDALLSRFPEADVEVLPAGEKHKTLETASRIWNFLADRSRGRNTVLVALGGGVVGDITGFAAACWMRGIDFIQVPTTLLAQVDASVGGKTAVDLPAGKNLVGAFHQPIAVFADTRTLATLPERDYAAGLAEVIKAALIADPVFLAWIEDNAARLRDRDPEALIHAIHRSCEIKAAVVADDEREHGNRALLNLGHTFAHALESVTGYRRFLHGEAVAIGLMLAAAMSERHGGLDPGLRPRLAALLGGFGLPLKLPGDVSAEAMLDAMRLDKKHAGDKWRLILLQAPGQAVIREITDKAAIRAVLDAGSPTAA